MLKSREKKRDRSIPQAQLNAKMSSISDGPTTANINQKNDLQLDQNILSTNISTFKNLILSGTASVFDKESQYAEQYRDLVNLKSSSRDIDPHSNPEELLEMITQLFQNSQLQLTSQHQLKVIKELTCRILSNTISISNSNVSLMTKVIDSLILTIEKQWTRNKIENPKQQQQ